MATAASGPPGYPDVVYVGGSYLYNEPANIANGRALVLSIDAGVSFTDVTKDATDNFYPNGLHPGHHALVVNPGNQFQFFDGSQDNGTFQTSASPTYRAQTFWGDGGQSGFDVADGSFRFHTFYDATPDVYFTNGAIHDWNWIGDKIYWSGEPRAFYIPITSDPRESGWMFAGLSHVWRTKTHGRGTLSVNGLRALCNEFTGVFTARFPRADPESRGGATAAARRAAPFP